LTSCHFRERGNTVDIGAENAGKGSNLAAIGDKGAAYKYYLDHKDAAPDLDGLRKERESLLARIAKIDTILNN
jgi:hypothetical protein